MASTKTAKKKAAPKKAPLQTSAELLHELSQPAAPRPTNTGGELRREFREQKGTRPANAYERRNRFKKFAEVGRMMGTD